MSPTVVAVLCPLVIVAGWFGFIFGLTRMNQIDSPIWAKPLAVASVVISAFAFALIGASIFAGWFQ